MATPFNAFTRATISHCNGVCRSDCERQWVRKEHISGKSSSPPYAGLGAVIISLICRRTRKRAVSWLDLAVVGQRRRFRQGGRRRPAEQREVALKPNGYFRSFPHHTVKVTLPSARAVQSTASSTSPPSGSLLSDLFAIRDNDTTTLHCPTQWRVFTQGQVRAHLENILSKPRAGDWRR